MGGTLNTCKISIFFIVAVLNTPISLGAPQRSIQLGGTGPRPVAVGAGVPVQQGPAFSQQLAFGPGPTLSQLQYQPQQQQQQQVGRFRVQQQQQQQQQPQNPSSSSFPPIGSFPIPANPRQPILLQSPQTTTASEEEYDDEYIEEQPQQQLVSVRTPQALPTLRPYPGRQQTTQPQQQRNAVRVTPSYSTQTQPGAGSQRFIVPQQQPAPVQTRRPVARPAQAQEAPATNTYQARPVLQQAQPGLRLGQDSRLFQSNDRQSTTPAPVQTIDRYMRQNQDGSMSWGYTNEDGTFKEETLGVDCVVRGKYGYVDPDGVKREYEYQSGNPCDPNKRGQPEEEEEEENVPLVIGGRPVQSQQRLGGLLNARPAQQQQYQPQLRQQQQQQQQQQRYQVQS